MRVLRFVLLLLLLPVAAFATVLLPADFATVVRGSDLIVVGAVVDVRARLTGDRAIESFVTVAVSDTLKGERRSEVTFRVPNGTVGRYRRITVGAPEFAVGDKAVVFLRARSPLGPTLFGLSQGVYRIGEVDGGAVVLPAPLMARGIGAERVVRGDPARQPLPLADFVRAVRTAMVAR